jgi:phosphonopyruvate decarboxylase
MIDAPSLCARFRESGRTFFTGVPCSYFAALVEAIERDQRSRYVPAAHEGAALSLAAGAVLGGERPVVMLQNSGLGNLVNPAASLVSPYRLPVLTLISHRGDPGAPADEPQHDVMGRTTEALLGLLGIPTRRLPDEEHRLSELLSWADTLAEGGRCAAVLIGRHQLSPPAAPSSGSRNGSSRPTTTQIVESLRDSVSEGDVVLSTTGYISRRLHAVGDRSRNFYMQGSMGHLITLAMGLASARPERRVIAVDGDGASIMHMGSMSTVGHLRLSNLLHVIIDNESYESTGGQRSTSSTTRLDRVALACGYARADLCTDLSSFQAVLRERLATPGPAAIVVKAAADPLPPPARATATVSAVALRDRLQAALIASPDAEASR